MLSNSEDGSKDQPNGSDLEQEPISQITDEDAIVDSKAVLHVTSYKEAKKCRASMILLARLIPPIFLQP